VIANWYGFYFQLVNFHSHVVVLSVAYVCPVMLRIEESWKENSIFLFWMHEHCESFEKVIVISENALADFL